MSRASDAARARILHVGQREPTITPVTAVNRAKEALGIPHAPTNPLMPNGVALVNGLPVEGRDSPYTPLPEGLTQKQLYSLEAAGLTTMERIKEATDDDLLALDGIGQATLRLLRNG